MDATSKFSLQGQPGKSQASGFIWSIFWTHDNVNSCILILIYSLLINEQLYSILGIMAVGILPLGIRS